MGKYTQFNRPLKINTPLGADALFITGFRGQERLSQLFQFHLDLIAEKYTEVPFDRLLGQECTVELTVNLSILPLGVTRYFSGIVSQFSQGRRDSDFTYFKADLAPRLWLLTKQVNSRVFQQQTVPQILATVLTGLTPALRLSETYLPRDFCVQYQESDFAFASRLMEDEGIYYFFEHDAQGHHLVLSDSTSQLREIATPDTVLYEEVDGGLRGDLRINALQKTQSLCATKSTLWDHHFELPTQSLEAAQAIQDQVECGSVAHRLGGSPIPLEIYEFPGGYAHRFDGVDPGGNDRSADLANIFPESGKTVRVRMQAEAAASLTITGTSNCLHFSPGGKFSLLRHFNGDGKYLLTRVDHEVQLVDGYRTQDSSGALTYTNRFTSLPDGLPFRPQRETPRPKILGMQTATVVGPAGQELFCDKYGRVKVQFHWDRLGGNDSNSSCWVRVAQVWAGKTWGAFFWPRIGHEVVVAFEEGNPDTPIIVGSVYNAGNMPPVTLPTEAKLGGVKSCIFGGDPGVNFNAVIFNDAPGSERVQIHSETHQMNNVEASQFSYVPVKSFSFNGSFPL